MYETGICEHIDTLDETELLAKVIRRYAEQRPDQKFLEVEIDALGKWFRRVVIDISLLHMVLSGEAGVALRDGEVEFWRLT